MHQQIRMRHIQICARKTTQPFGLQISIFQGRELISRLSQIACKHFNAAFGSGVGYFAVYPRASSKLCEGLNLQMHKELCSVRCILWRAVFGDQAVSHVYATERCKIARLWPTILTGGIWVACPWASLADVWGFDLVLAEDLYNFLYFLKLGELYVKFLFHFPACIANYFYSTAETTGNPSCNLVTTNVRGKIGLNKTTKLYSTCKWQPLFVFNNLIEESTTLMRFNIDS